MVGVYLFGGDFEVNEFEEMVLCLMWNYYFLI